MTYENHIHSGDCYHSLAYIEEHQALEDAFAGRAGSLSERVQRMSTTQLTQLQRALDTVDVFIQQEKGERNKKVSS